MCANLNSLFAGFRRYARVSIALFAFTVLGAAQASSFIFVHDALNNLLKVDTVTATATLVGNMGTTAGTLTDIAFSPSGELWGITFQALYRINPQNATVTRVGDLGINGMNALEFGPDGTLYAASNSSNSLYRVNLSTGVATALPGSMGASSAGDLAFNNGHLYMATSSGQLLRVNIGLTVSGTSIGPFGVPNVYGLATDATGRLIATAGTTVYLTNVATGELSLHISPSR